MGDGVPAVLFEIAGVGMAVHIICTFILRRTLAPDSDVFEQLFTRPLAGGITGAPLQLQGRYFMPWVPAPEVLNEESTWVRLLFWGARLGGTALGLGLLGFLGSELYIGTIGHS